MNCMPITNSLQYKTLPRTMSGTAAKNCRNAAKAYEALADAYQQLNNLPKLKAQVNAGIDLWAEVSSPQMDRNMMDMYCFV